MRKPLFLLALFSLSLASCADTDQLYDANAYRTGTFEDHVYKVWEGETLQAYAQTTQGKTLKHDAQGYFNGSGRYEVTDTTCSLYGYKDAQTRHPNWFITPENQPLYWGGPGDAFDDIMDHHNSTGWVDNSSLYDKIYSQNKRLDRFYPKFSRGYLSKLYNGQIKCDGWSYLALVLAESKGFGTMFPYELASAEYIAFPLLVGTGESPREGGFRRIVSLDIHFTFYKYADTPSGLAGYKVTCSDVELQCNCGSAYTSLMGFTFADAGLDPRGIVGMSITYDVKNDPRGLNADFSTEGPHVGLCVYEMLVPDSTWY